MSELVEKVQKAMAFEMNRKEDGWIHYKYEARAAIAAVAEWLDEQGFDSTDLAIDLIAELKGTPK